jgi:hypothetical protein
VIMEISGALIAVGGVLIVFICRISCEVNVFVAW